MLAYLEINFINIVIVQKIMMVHCAPNVQETSISRELVIHVTTVTLRT